MRGSPVPADAPRGPPFHPRPQHTSGRAFCSQFVMQVLTHAGITLKGITHAHKATPSELFRAAHAAGALN